MDDGLKSSIIERFLRQNHAVDLDCQQELGDYLDSIEKQHQDWLHFETILTSPQWQKLAEILCAGFQFKGEELIMSEALNTQAMDDKALVLRAKSQLSDANYYARYTQWQAPESEIQQSLIDLRDKLAYLPELGKLIPLKCLRIPQANGSHENYYQLLEDVGGVTEKISLIRSATLKSKLSYLRQADLSVSENREPFKLIPEAILKLPKHKSICEVQREAIALDISRILGFDTAQSLLVVHNDEPALFVPFDAIDLLNHFAQGDSETAAFSSKTYVVNSTIKPIGEGLQADVFIEDFGQALAYLYLCNDPDSIGAYNQNKALRNARTLFIFDQAVKTQDVLGLDSRLALFPDHMIMKFSRHGQGRNCSLVNDSSIHEKLHGINNLLVRKEQIIGYLTTLIAQHEAQISKLTKEISQEKRETNKLLLYCRLNQTTQLIQDATAIQTSIVERLKNLAKIISTQGHQDNLTQSRLILEKLVNNPVIFSPLGRPFKCPSTSNHSSKIQSIEKIEDKVLINFSHTINKEKIEFIQRHGCSSLKQIHSKKWQINLDEFLALSETLLYPEMTPMLQDLNYLDSSDLSLISQYYYSKDKSKLFKLIDNYSKGMENIDPRLVMDKIRSTLNQIEQHHDGLAKHIQKKLHFDVQQRLTKIIQQSGSPRKNQEKSISTYKLIDQAFTACVELDRVKSFHGILMTVIQTNRLHSKPFNKFLMDCITAHKKALNYVSATEQSKFIETQAINYMLRLEGTGKNTHFTVWQSSSATIGTKPKAGSPSVAAINRL